MARRLFTERVRLDRGGYTSSGRYFGTGAPLYRVSDADGHIDEYVRASSAAEARRKIMQKHGMKLPKERLKIPRYRPHAFRKPEEVKKEYSSYAKFHAKLARQADKAAAERARTHGKSDALVKKWRAEARRERALARKGLAQAKRFRGVYSRDRRSH
jgi:hypothetical protein